MPLNVFEPIQEYSVERELRGPTPRRLRPAPAPIAIAVLILGMYALLLVGALILVIRSLPVLWLAQDGHVSMATVTSCGYDGGGSGACSDSSRVATFIRYGFGPSNRYEGSAPLASLGVAVRAAGPSGDVSRQAQRLPTHILIRYGFWGGRLVSYPAQGVSTEAAVLSIVAAIMIGVSATWLIAIFLRWVKRIVRLLVYGAAVVGTITDKEIREHERPRYYLTYGFLDVDGAPHQRSEWCTPDQWRRLEIGQPVTVIYPVAQPSRSELYGHLVLRCK